MSSRSSEPFRLIWVSMAIEVCFKISLLENSATWLATSVSSIWLLRTRVFRISFVTLSAMWLSLLIKPPSRALSAVSPLIALSNWIIVWSIASRLSPCRWPSLYGAPVLGNPCLPWLPWYRAASPYTWVSVPALLLRSGRLGASGSPQKLPLRSMAEWGWKDFSSI